jgi:hypothetical protein
MATRLTPEALPDYFVRYLFEKYHGTRHVRRVASWVGFVVKSIERVVGATFERRRSRQIEFDYHGRQFKVRYVHRTKASPRGGIRLSTSRRVAAHRLVIRRPGVEPYYRDIPEPELSALLAEMEAIGDDADRFQAFVTAAD